MTLAEALAQPASKKVLLVTLVAGQTLPFWTQDGATWWAATPHRVVGLWCDGAALDPAAWSWNGDTGRVTVIAAELPGTADPRAHVVQARVAFRLANHPKRWGDEWYAGRLLRAPDVSLRVEARFGGVGQLGGGRLELANGDSWFETLGALDWDAGECALELGVDL